VKTICDNAFQMSVNNKLCTYEEKYARLGFTVENTLILNS
jgi:hypothetical protein